MLQKIARKHPFLWLGGLTLAIMALGPFVPLAYDDGGLGTAWFVATYALTVIFRKAAVVGTSLLGQETGLVHGLLTVIGGGAVYVFADVILSFIARRGGRSAAAPRPS